MDMNHVNRDPETPGAVTEKQMTRYERITFVEKPKNSPRSVILKITGETSTLLCGIEINREGDEIRRGGVDEIRHVISKDMLAKRVELVMNNMFAMLEAK